MRVLTAIVALSLAGCSFGLTSSHPTTTENGERVCSGGGPIVVDGIIGVLGIGLGTATIIEDRSSHGELAGLGTLTGSALIALTLPWAIGAVVGISRNGDCNRELRRPAV